MVLRYNSIKPMFWADRIAKTIIDSGKYKPYWVDDMKTPSGRIHVGSLRGVIIHDLVYKALLDAGNSATFTYVFEDQDPMDALPHYLDANKWSQYLGQPLFTIPSPDDKAPSFAHFYANEFQEVFNKIGATPQILWSGDLYRSGRMNEGIKTCLDKVAIIREIYNETYKKRMADDWYPFQVMCPKCQKESTTRVTHWDGKEVTFACKVDAVEWTRGCGFKGKISPFSGGGEYHGKLSWKVEWPVKWMVIGVTVEGAGKDHMSAGGSHDIAKLICDRVLHFPVPYPVAYEFFLIGGKKMSSSKGLGSSSKEVSEILPPYLLRFLFTRTDFNQTIDFDPVVNMYIPDLFDEYDRCWQAYIENGDENLARAFILAQISKVPDKEKIFIPRFKDVANYIEHPNVDLKQKFAEIKGSVLTVAEEKILAEREQYARIWIGKYAPPEYKMQMVKKLPEQVGHLTDEQKKYLAKIVSLIEVDMTADKLQLALYNLAKESQLETKQAFAAIYTAFIGSTHGPRAAWFLLQYPKEQVIARLKKASADSGLASPTGRRTTFARMTTNSTVPITQRPDLFSISDDIKIKYPSISVGIALIKNVHIAKTNPQLELEKKELLVTLQALTTEQLGKYPEVVSYRKLYKEMGIDWHSRRPSPEALLRRVVLGKGLYTVNTCVDAYNLVVMKHRVSVGAFDADNIKFPTVLRFAGEGDQILLLGDSEPTKYHSSEITYYDGEGGYNIDFNFRDAQRTKVTEKTKNLWINVDGVFDITPEQVYQSLQESVELITKYCGGTVEVIGVVK